MDILPPKRKPTPVVTQQPVSPPVETPVNTPTPPPAKAPMPLPKRRLAFLRRKLFWVLTVVVILVLAAVSSLLWYNWALQPVNGADDKGVRLIVTPGETSREITDNLGKAGLVRSSLAARIYIELSGQKHKLQAGGYILSRNMNVSDIVEHIVSGKTDELNVTIIPGLTLKELADPEVKGSLAQQGFSSQEIEAAFSATYDSPLLADKPAGQTLEGYIYPETYRMAAGDKLSTVIQRSFDELYQRLQDGGLLEKFKARKLNLHQALTLASIVGREVANPAEQKQVAQVFYLRLSQNMVLGSDVTFEYAAEQLGVTPAVDIDSPYNTRINPGLPPGPIATMNLSALEAVANPAKGNYLYFVSGDNGKTYFARTFEEHEANIAAHCHDLCNLY